jgi:hypothetical protein
VPGPGRKPGGTERYGTQDLRPPLWKMKPPWRRSLIRNQVSGKPQGFGSSVFRSWMANWLGASSGLNPDGRASAEDRDLRYPLAATQPVKGPA